MHLNQLDPSDDYEIHSAFVSAALVACALLKRNFTQERFRVSRDNDPIIGVSFTGLFDFFVKLFGLPWLEWWQAGRKEKWNLQPDGTYLSNYFFKKEQDLLTSWRKIVQKTVGTYCKQHQLKTPNRCTTVQPAGTKSLLTNASPGWHPPKAVWFLRRVTFAKKDPVALACLDMGYNVVPGQADKDENGNLLNDPFGAKCTEWLVELPSAVSWALISGVDKIDISAFSASSQFDFYMNVQKNWTTHNTSATIELRNSEIEEVGLSIHEAIEHDEGYISSTLLARYDDHQSFPRLPFEPITQAEYFKLKSEVLSRRKNITFEEALLLHTNESNFVESTGAPQCDSDKCLTGSPQKKHDSQ